MDESSFKSLAEEVKYIKSSLLAIQDFLGTLAINNNSNNNSSNMGQNQPSNNEATNEPIEVVEETTEEGFAPPSITKLQFSTPQSYQSPIPIQNNKFNIRRLSSSGGMDNLKRAFLLNNNREYAENDTANDQHQQFSSIEEIVKLFGGKDIITEINILWYFANLQSTSRESTQTQSVMIASSESFFLGKLEALKTYRICRFDILHVASRIVKIMDLLSVVRGVDSIPALGFIDTSLKGLVIAKYNMLHDSAELDRTLILKFEQASSAVLTNPTNYGLGALIYLVIKCISGLRDNSAFTSVLKKLNMWVPSVHEGAVYSISLALQALQMYNKLFAVVMGMSNLLFPTAMESYPKHVLVGIYKAGLVSENLNPNPFTRVVNSLGVYEYKSVSALFNYLLELFTSNSHELAPEGTPLKLSWGTASRHRTQGRHSYVKTHPIINAFSTAPGFDPLLDDYEIPDTEIDEYLNALAMTSSGPELATNVNDNQYSYDDDYYYDGYVEHADNDEGYLRSVFAESQQIEQLNALSSMDAPCWVHFGHELFQDPKPCSRGAHCKHSHSHNDETLADLYKTRHRDMHLKMLKSSKAGRSSERRFSSNGGRQPHSSGGRGFRGYSPPKGPF